MSWLLYDDGVGGHHIPYLRVIDEELVRRDSPPVVASAFPPDGDAPERWIPVESLPHRDLIGRRRQMQQMVAAGLEQGADTLIDLFFDTTAWAIGLTRPFPQRVYVLHHIDQLTPEARQGLGRWRARLLRSLVRSRLDGASVVVHTEAAAEVMAAAFGDSRVFLAPYPVAPVQGLPPSDGSPPHVPLLAFAGGARREKGLSTLAQAVQLLDHEVEVAIFGPQPPGTRERYAPLFQSVPNHWFEEMLNVPELRQRLASASLVVLPYRDRFGRYGGSSATLLDTVAAGAPAVVSPALEDQLPPGYGAVVAEKGEDPRHLAAAIESALEELEELRGRAQRVGPAFVESTHSAAAYVDVLERAARASG